MTRLGSAALLAALGPWFDGRAASAQAAARERITVVTTSSTPLVERFCVELRELGFEVSVEATPSAAAPAALEATARRNHAAFAIGVTETPAELQLVGVDPAGAPLLHENIARAGASPDDDDVVALRAAELTRASALGLEEENARAPRDSEATVEKVPPLSPPVPVLASAPAEPARATSATSATSTAALAVDGGVALAMNLAQTTATPGLSLAGFWQFDTRLAAGIWGSVPFGAASLSAPSGSAKLWSGAVGAGIRADFSRGRGSFVPLVGVGAALVWHRVRATSTAAGYATHDSQRAVTGGPYAELGLGYRFTRSFALLGSTRAIVAFPDATVSLGGIDAATLGRPFFIAGLEFEYRADFSGERD